MMPAKLKAIPLTAAAFAPFGDVIELSGAPDKIINQGMCGRYNDLAVLDFAEGRAGLSVFDAKARHLPLVVDMVERHPEGSQAFIPISGAQFLIVVADDDDGVPVNLRAFVTEREQSVNFHRGIWHGVLAPLDVAGRFVIVDRIGVGNNLEEYWLDDPCIVELASPDN